MDTKIYPRYAAARAKKSPIVKDCLIAFVSGGIICTAGQGLLNFYRTLGLSQENAGMLVSSTLVFIAALLTGFGIFDKIAKHTGAGTVVPITGFANAISSAAIDNKTEGLILGVGSKIFSVAGPVILYGISAGFVYGVIYWLLTTFIL
ncbi:MAG: stage V sporulation protein AC [Clostridia bacterium]|nr:stage V sporulation protein AC [Clostridia bacterium]